MGKYSFDVESEVLEINKFFKKFIHEYKKLKTEAIALYKADQKSAKNTKDKTTKFKDKYDKEHPREVFNEIKEQIFLKLENEKSNLSQYRKFFFEFR